MGNRAGWLNVLAGVAIATGLGGCSLIDLDGMSAGGAQSARLIRMGDYAMTHGDRVTAIALYEQALAMDPDSEDARSRLAPAQQSVGANVSALETYRQAAERSPDDPVALRRLGNALIAETYPERAMAYLEKSIALADAPQTRNSLGVAFDMLGQHRQAQDQYRVAMTLAPTDIDLASNLALSMALNGDFDAAIALAEEVSSTNGAGSRHRQTYALVLGLSGQDDHAAEVAGVDLSPGQVAANLDYYQLLRSVEPSAARAMAITTGMGAPNEFTQVGLLVDLLQPADDAPTVLIAAVPR